MKALTLVKDRPVSEAYRGIVVGFCIYVVFVILGSLREMYVLNSLGTIPLILITLSKAARRSLRHLRDRSIQLLLIILFLILFGALLNIQTIQLMSIIKYLIIYSFYYLMFSLDCEPPYQSKYRKVFIATIYVLVILSFALGKNLELSEQERLSGIFINPNNFVLIGLSLLFFINEEEDKPLLCISIHLTVIIALVFSGTLGAILGYIVAVGYKLWVTRRETKYLVVCLLFLGVVGILIVPEPILTVYPLNRILVQFAVIQDQFINILDNNRINYGYLLSEYGPQALSGIWRLEHWSRIALEIINSDAIKIILGHGAGSSYVVLNTLPHNEYLRILFEQGFAGLVLHVMFFMTIWKRASYQQRYVMLIYFVFSFSENNFDNFFYMLLFMIYLAACGQHEPMNTERRLVMR